MGDAISDESFVHTTLTINCFLTQGMHLLPFYYLIIYNLIIGQGGFFDLVEL